MAADIGNRSLTLWSVIVCWNPVVLAASLEKQIVPAYELVYRFFQSDKDTFTLLNFNPTFFGESRVVHNIKVLVENGVTDSNIARLLRSQFKIFHIRHITVLVEELKHLGFHPSTSIFTIALIAKTSVPKIRWKAKVDAFKKWGWSDENVVEAFRNQPHCMLTSVDKINLVMSFWVNQLGWDVLALAKVPRVFGASLERRIIPRGSVVHYLWKNGLLKRNASLSSPFVINEKKFLEIYINPFKEEASDLLKLYQEKLNLAQNKDKFSEWLLAAVAFVVSGYFTNTGSANSCEHMHLKLW
ncbi:uncharacterized protein LOC131597849 [Vicia villosa]|uniref:uncharacterized protein LOC131597849 n=1 Tax=Vicia villosa TaxID=3911 RepID=UPI00273AF02F|nr:uncharacterized protein LOC131597849 [Vicia villosa]